MLGTQPPRRCNWSPPLALCVLLTVTSILGVIGVALALDRSREGNTTVVSVSPGLGLGFATLTTNTFATAESPTAPRCPNSAIIPASLAIIPASPAGIPASLAGRK
jgi:hypothetical protein